MRKCLPSEEPERNIPDGGNHTHKQSGLGIGLACFRDLEEARVSEALV